MFSGILPGKLVDSCLSDLMTGDPFMIAHQGKSHAREERATKTA